MRQSVERNGKVDVSMVGVESELSGERILRTHIFVVRDSKGLYMLECMMDNLRLTFFNYLCACLLS